MRPSLNEEERVEIHAALELRVDQLKKLKKLAEQVGAHAAVREADERIALLRGKDGDPGLMSKFVDQTTLDFNGGKSEPGKTDDDLFDGADRSTKSKRARGKARVAADAVNEADRSREPDFEVEETPPPNASQVSSLVPTT